MVSFPSENLITHFQVQGRVSELADEHDLGSCAARREGSSPSSPTQDREA
jgi:hypothetical protein